MYNPSFSNSNILQRAALYIRVSSEEQAREGYSLIAQKEKIKEYAEKNGYLLSKDNIYIDDGYSGKTKDRPALSTLFADAQKKLFDVVLVYRLDRFFRNTRLLLESVEALGNFGIGLKSITEPFDTSTPIGRYVLTNLGAIAELERAIILERKELGTLKAAQAGKWMGGTPPYGYNLKRKSKKLQIAPKEAVVVKMLYDWLTKEKLTFYQIQKRINCLKIPTKFDKLKKTKPTGSKGWWRKPTLGRIFSNEIYAGTFWYRKYKNPSRAKTKENLRPKEEWIPISVPQIISKVQFELARRQIEENRKLSPRRTIRSYLFAKKLYCGICGGIMVAQYQQPGKKRITEVKFYTCHKRFKQHAPVLCPQKSIVEEKIEIPLWEAIKKLLMQPEEMLKELSLLQRKDDPRPALETKQASIERQRKQVEGKEARLLDLYVEGAIEKVAFLERSRKLEREKETLARQSMEISQTLISEEERTLKAQSLRQLYKKLRVNIEEADYETKRLVIELLVNRIVVNQDQLNVECHIPNQFFSGEKSFQVALSNNGRVDCDSKHKLCFSVRPLPHKSLSEIRREQNLRYSLKRNLFYPDGRLKTRLGGKPKESYTLKWHTRKFKDTMALEKFLKLRDIIISSGLYKEEVRKRYIAYVDKALYNRFLLLPKNKIFWLAVKGANINEYGLHSYSDGIHTFFKIVSDVPLLRVREIIKKHGYMG
jgi:site-specific DNA recombinase